MGRGIFGFRDDIARRTDEASGLSKLALDPSGD
jgi:hypothetical protein